MKVSQLTACIVALYNANRAGMVWGSPGLGKSYGFKTAAKVLRDNLGLTGPVLMRHEIKAYRDAGGDMRQAFGLFDLRLSQMDPVEIGGLPRENKSTGAMDKLPPSWFAHEGRNDLPDHGLLLMEELPTAPLSVQTAAYQITLDNVIEDFKLKCGWGCFAAGNRVLDGGQYYKMPDALADRFCHLDVESDLDGWVEWAIDRGIDPSLIGFVRFRPELLNTHAAKVAAKSKDFAFTTERTYEGIHEMLVNNPGIDDTTLGFLLSGAMGSGPAAEYIGFRQVWTSVPDVAEILIDPMSARLPTDSATSYATLTMLAARASYDNLPNCIVYAERFFSEGRPEMMVLFMKDMQSRGNLKQKKAQAEGRDYLHPINSPAYATWSARHVDLF